jgi:signal transduction histidine kinase
MMERPEARSRLDVAVDDLDATIRDIRRSIFALGSTADSADIQAEVSRMVDRAAATLKFRPVLRFEGPVRALVTADVAPELLAVLGEALSNAAKHAQADTVSVVVSAGDAVTLTVTDDGRGIPEGAVESGLSNMRHRAERLGGTLTVRSGPPSGTTIVWSVPTS